MKLKYSYLLVILFLLPSLTNAQCAMCRAVLESQDSQGMAQGVNDGIIYLMIIPYVLVIAIGFLVYRTYKKG